MNKLRTEWARFSVARDGNCVCPLRHQKLCVQSVYVNDTAMMRTFLILAGPFWFGLALVFVSSLMLCVLKQMPSPPWDSDDDGDFSDREDSPAPFDRGARRSEAVGV